jgi:hypothetical protein
MTQTSMLRRWTGSTVTWGAAWLLCGFAAGLGLEAGAGFRTGTLGVSATVLGSCRIVVPAYVRDAKELDEVLRRSKCGGSARPAARVALETGRIRYNLEF